MHQLVCHGDLVSVSAKFREASLRLKNDAAHEDDASRIGKAEKHANEYKANDVFKMSIGSHFWSHQNR